MLTKSILAATALATTVLAQGRPSNMSICDYYTTALLMNNTAENQKTLLTLVVNTAVIGNYTKPNVGIMVPGILAPGMVNGEAVNLLPYFNGELASTNTGGMVGRSVNFLDGGGAAPLMKNMASNNPESNQETLLTHLYEYFGTLLGCSMQGGDAYPAYDGGASMYQVHKFMALSNAEVTYFITQVGLSAASFGVATADVTAVGTALGGLFNYRCAPPAVVIPSQPAELQSICIDSDCMISPNATCASYAAVVKPMMAGNSTMSAGTTATSTMMGGAGATSTMMGGSGATTTAAGGGSGSGTATSTPSIVPANAGAVNGAGVMAILAGVAAFLL